jgi:hypothetical protein
MVQRIVLGDRSGAKGLWISRPGYSAYSNNTQDFLVDGSVEQSQPWMTGSFDHLTYTGQTTDPVYGVPASYFQQVIYHNLAYRPMFWSWKDYNAATGYGPQSDINYPPHYYIVYTDQFLLARGYIGWYPGRSVAWTGDFGLGFTFRYVIFRNRIQP